MLEKSALNILVCSENEAIFSSIVQWLPDENFKFHHFHDFESGIESSIQDKYDIFILSLAKTEAQGRLDGLNALPIFRKIDPNIPIIVIAPYDSLEIEKKARVAGIFYYLVEPLSREEIRTAIYSAVKKVESAS